MSFRKGIVGEEEVSEALFFHNFAEFFFQSDGVKGLKGYDIMLPF